MYDPFQNKSKDDLVSSLSLWAFALAFGTIAFVVVGTFPHTPW